jgi:branched-chain amino acid aminotransferase
MPSIWVNGERRNAAEPNLSAHDRGFTLADGLFETMRTRGETVFFLDRHLARLRQGLAALAIPVPPELRDWVMDAVRGAAGDASVRLTVTRGIGVGGVAPGSAPPTVVVAVNALPAFPPAVYASGIAVHVASGRRNERAMTAGLKTLSYTDAVAAFIEAQRAGADDALFLDTEGHCSEATSSNLFMGVSGALVTPPVTCGALPGITRAIVIELAGTLGLTVVERAFDLAELLRADEAFLTSSLRGIAPLVRVGDRPIGRGAPGTLTARLTAGYAGLFQ